MRIDWEKVARAHLAPARERILEIVATKPPNGSAGWSPKMIAATMETPLPNISYHVAQLAKMGIVTLVDTRPRRGAVEHFYRLEARRR